MQGEETFCFHKKDMKVRLKFAFINQGQIFVDSILWTDKFSNYLKTKIQPKSKIPFQKKIKLMQTTVQGMEVEVLLVMNCSVHQTKHEITCKKQKLKQNWALEHDRDMKYTSKSTRN